jgi:hypothetical protein|nr:MAG TPA: Minichromosome maintenance protein MCM [Caudoviricetes sp.]
MNAINYPEMVYHAICDLHNKEQVVSRELLSEVTGLKMADITKFTKLLVENGKIYRVTRGIFKPVEGFNEPRVISITSMPNGIVILEIGDDVLHLQPQEVRQIGVMLSGYGMECSNLQLGREFSILRNFYEAAMNKTPHKFISNNNHREE